VLVVLAVTVAVTAAGCVSPAWDDHDYALKAQATAETVASTLQIVRLAVRDSARLTQPYLKTVLTEAATDLSSAGQQFGGVQPPSDASDQVRDKLLDHLQQAEDEVDHLLIQVRRGGLEDPAGAARKLGQLAEGLQ
jgi:hypothetical protein